jgi:GTPase SAR1 family protein
MTPKGHGLPVEIPWYKVILLGDCGVGKTSLIRRITMGAFTYDRVPTQCMDEVTRYVHPTKMLRNSTIANNEPVSGPN